MSYIWPDTNGNPVNMTALTNEQLLSNTQRLVDSHRRFLDDCLKQIAEGDEFEVSVYHMYNTVMTFTGRIKAMIDECQSRGLALNINR